MHALRSTLTTLGALSILAAGNSSADSPPPIKIPSIAEKTATMTKQDGLFPIYWDARAGVLYLEIPRLDTEYLYQTGIAAGMGSNDIGLDRGALADTRIVSFQRVGPKVLMVQANLAYRASSPDADERRAVTDAFATSILCGFTVAAESDGRVLVDATDLLFRDVVGAVHGLQPAAYHFDPTRSAVYLPHTRAFPRNTELEVTTTLVTDGVSPGPGQIGGRIADVTPSADALTIRQHHSLVQLPDGNFTPRRYDPRAGYFNDSYVDFSAPFGADVNTRFIARHRLVKKDPTAALSEPVEPIVYYVDRGTPEPIRSALLEGASWWSAAFEAAGFKNAFRVELLPEGADPMDVRYNVINWVHRSTRGWSYGASVVDPRTGEIIKGQVLLGSLRAQEDYLIGEGLTSPYVVGNEHPRMLTDLVLARLRQLAAHEVGHTLGLAHNYYDSERGRISVMDYPQPLVTLKPDGSLDFSQAYATGIGEWDKVAIAYGYAEPSPGVDRNAALRKILDDAWTKDLRYFSNQDLDVHPRVDQWSNGVNQAAELTRIMDVRRAALARLGESAIQRDWPMAMIEDVLVPIYLYHRYTARAAAASLGGQDYIYALRGDGRQATSWVPAAQQEAALAALLRTLAPGELTFAKELLAKLPPRPPGFDRTRELFPRNTGMVFDPIAPAAAAADMTIGFILMPDRAARLVVQKAIDPKLPGLDDVIDRLVKATFAARLASPYEAEIERAIERVLVDRLIGLAAESSMSEVSAIATQELASLLRTLGHVPAGTPAVEAAHRALLGRNIQRFLDHPGDPTTRGAGAPVIPPGAPIGEAPGGASHDE